ncbi:MAG: hypothetical protein IAE77_25730 [Prosthecobacter sp.]|uniref:hypothetical protein n=1 Tax=Prosthecobacter sp. TaxID=1965333 RepID=UPI001A09D19E|nr:hypothetical protein [Prosthecobacter sp.]MBE2286883.1 hypothetical protein [Prosthecobacter sp.]
MFDTPVSLTADSPGVNFAQVEGNLMPRPGGPHLAGGPAASADIRYSNGHAIGRYLFPNTHKKIFACGWFLIKEVLGQRTDLIGICNVNGGLSPSVSIVNGQLGAAISWSPYTTFMPSNMEWTSRWVFIGVAVHIRPDSNADVRYYCKYPGGAMQSWGAINDSPIGMTDMAQVIAGSWAFGPLVKGRMGAPAVYTFDEADFSDIVYPTDLIEPATGRTWFCDPESGNDLADGTTPLTAWKTAAKINEESLETGMLPAPGYATGDTLVINTGGQPLDLNGVALNLRTPGLNVRAASGQEWIRIKSYRSLQPGVWQATGTPHVYSCADTQASAVLWEDDKFMNHPVGTSFAAVAAQLSSVPGSFWTDGTLLYVHPFGSTDPRTDGKRYERSYKFTEGAAVVINARDMNLQDIHAGKTCLADWVTNDPLGNYCLGGSMPPGKAVIKHCYLYYGAKHIIGITVGDVADDVLIEDVQAEQASPYPPAGYQTAWVSYNHQDADLGIIHRYHRCRTVANAGLIGSTEGVMSLAYPVFYAHNMGGGQQPQFKRFEFFDCDFGNGGIEGEAVKRVELQRTRCGSVWMGAEVVAEQCFFRGMNVGVPGWSLTERNCIHVVQGELRRNPAGGALDLQGCTFDARQITGIQGGVPQASLFTREQPLNFVFRNNLVLMPATPVWANVFSNFRSTDQLQMSHNAYSLGGNALVYQYHDGTSAQNRSLAEWQALGFDASSFQSASMTLNGLAPGPGSPLINAGLNLATLTDYSGATFRKRNDIGAYEAYPTSYALWQAENFTPAQMAYPALVGASASYLGDGVPNLVKYALGLHADELASAAAPLISLDKTTPAAPVMNVHYQRSPWAGDLSVELQFSENLVQWDAVPAGAQQVIATEPAVQEMRAVITPPSGVRGFVRLRVVQP